MKRLPPLGPLHAFLSVARLGSFCAAAEHLNLSQSAVSRQVERLELHFSCRLFERHTRLVTLTQQGQRLVPFAEKILALLDQTEHALMDMPQVLTVRAHPTLAMRWLLPRLPAFQQLHPGARLSVDTRSMQVPDFYRENIDLMIDFSSGSPHELHTEVLWHEQMTPVCLPKYLGADASLAGKTLLHTDPDGNEWRRWAMQANIDLSGSQHQFFDMLEMALIAARQGQGLALADTRLIEDLLRNSELVKPFSTTLDSGLAYRVLTPADKTSDPLLSSFRAWLREQVDYTGD